MSLDVGTDPESIGGQMPAGRVCAVVVAYYPDREFADRVCVILPQVDAMIVVDNTPATAGPSPLAAFQQEDGKLRVLRNGENRGLGFALNQGLDHALQSGCDWLLTLDQDTRCYSDTVRTLLNVGAACVPSPAVIGGNYFDPRNRKARVSTAFAGEFIEQKTVITSGSLVDVRLAHDIGGFRADYFVDQLDHEFCLRVRARGGRVVISRKPAMVHSVGESGGVWLPLLGRLPNHTPLRKYYVARNSFVTIAAYWRTEPDWCLRRVVRLVGGLILMATLERQRLANVRAFAAGMADALAGRMGACWKAF